ncbi:uncharacterized protein RCO7_03615 [Rhynchosporium graminicola]|uniref:T6SS Phospholipase effector Tle1-like catalytic domain-containing protein n=1 Tax=Rhynchosporium graminicola TaxID=2792576 RepID=A0A1E1LQM2_9HELO|nr:uncharacterized protein RCO7_03615 [Rhynchosporium commune]
MGTRIQEHWRPRSYPTQTYDPKTRNTSLSTMQTSVEDSVHDVLPKSIRAVRDSNAAYPRVRTLVICLDGTGDKFDNDNSNVVNFVACLKKDDPSQVTYYQSGIGTYDGHGLKGGVSAAVDMAVGSGLGIHIKDAYMFIMQNYREGDKICLLGFSRGSYTVRCLSGMLHKVGLLPKHNRAQVSFAYNFYKDDSKAGWEMSAQFKKTFCINVNVYFVGVWDCVSSVGFFPRKLPFGKSPTNSIVWFRHAMALDEHRAKFKLCQYEHQDPAARQKGMMNCNEPPPGKEKVASLAKLKRMAGRCFGVKPTPGVDDDGSDTDSNDEQEKRAAKFEKADHSADNHFHTDVLEVWFAGCHADIGGGAVANGERHMLSRIPLRWMLRQCFECNTGILFGTAALAETGIDVKTVWPVYKQPTKPVVGPSPGTVEKYEAKDLPPLRRRSTALGVDEGKDIQEDKIESNPSRRGNSRSLSAFDLLPEHVEDHFDAIAPLNDQLELAKGWWALEFWPVKVRVQDKATEEWKKVVRMNMGRFRAVRELEPNLHWSVEKRIGEGHYKIRNVVDKNANWRVTV